MRLSRHLSAVAVLAVLASPLAAQQRDTLTTGSAAGTLVTMEKPTIPQLVMVVDSQPARAERLGTLNDLAPTKVRMVDISELSAAADAAPLNEAITRNAEHIGNLRTILKANTVIAPLFESAEVDPDNVVAIDIDNEGGVWIFHRKS